MKPVSVISRFLVPGIAITLYCFFKFRCFVSPRSEVELGPNLVIGKNSRISSFTKIKSSGELLRIGERTDISSGCFLSAAVGRLIIGDDCLIGPNCSILSNNYNTSRMDLTFREQGHNSRGTRIGNNVLIGANTVVVDGSEIGDGVVVAANSLVSGKIPRNTVIQGNPARVIFVRR